MRAVLLKLRSVPLLAVIALSLLGGCKRGDDPPDDRTLEQRPHVETVKPDDRKDAFRP
ncbi:MAG: hypothetical protein ABSE73_00885 [Planctomycetota bacterium]